MLVVEAVVLPHSSDLTRLVVVEVVEQHQETLVDGQVVNLLVQLLTLVLVLVVVDTHLEILLDLVVADQVSVLSVIKNKYVNF
jgi:hypothetical protein